MAQTANLYFTCNRLIASRLAAQKHERKIHIENYSMYLLRQLWPNIGYRANRMRYRAIARIYNNRLFRRINSD